MLFIHNRPAAPMPPVPKEEPVPETCSRLSSDGEDDDGDDDREKLGYPHLAYHPRPAAVRFKLNSTPNLNKPELSKR